ncbi:hypothetical protein BX616_009792 [Lobosporangium transversale]|uniref:Galactose oxidase n=1 Tax=Lobosporangium transversale TaxID=64571 RepID=A0A1Y2GL12_9FUNG|nr:hypothetical protein BCR41DRAFT_397686 [Lobosporangium transversale]KAF9913639.1 hypothetical protein BX616_009792 [Lobosporangium transversale]ORZ12099.1 hypothetical protein BCR41DRAFT_397686 [Lobosporangium transversale]|eukprot:XP_021879964.1 hypothetical protein BCR41DRAFT_397686 [Lobosporangium transversale]
MATSSVVRNSDSSSSSTGFTPAAVLITHITRRTLPSHYRPRPSLPPLALLTLLILASTVPLLNTAFAIAYTPISYPATAILGSRLYIYGGITDLSSPLTSYTSQFATLSLTNGFDTDDDLPWEYLPGNIATGLAPGSPSRDQRRFIIGGSRNNLGKAPALIFDSTTRTWSQTGDLPNAGRGTDNNDEMQNYRRDTPDMALDTSTGALIQFGGSNATHFATNALTVLDTNRPSNMMNWSYTGYLESVPELYAPIVLYAPNNRLTLIMGGCDQVNNATNASTSITVPTHCATFDTLYALATDSIASGNPKVTRLNVDTTDEKTGQPAEIPAPRVMPCTVVMPDGNVLMMGGGSPGVDSKAMSDAWILNTQTWRWSRREIEDFPENGIMGHSCQVASNDQILVIGGHTSDGFVKNPLSVIKTRKWAWSNHYFVPGFSTAVKIGLSMSIVVVIGAIIAGLWIRWRRNKMSALKETQNQDEHGIRMKTSKGDRRSSGGTDNHHRKQSLSQHHHQSSSTRVEDRHHREHGAPLEGAEVYPENGRPLSNDIPRLDFTLVNDERSGSAYGHHLRQQQQQQPHLVTTDPLAHSPVESSSSTIVDQGVWPEPEHLYGLSQGRIQNHETSQIYEPERVEIDTNNSDSSNSNEQDKFGD